MPPSYRVVPTQGGGHRRARRPVHQSARRHGGVYAKQEISSHAAPIQNAAQHGLCAVAIGVLLGAVALIVNTIQLAIFARRREVAVMKLVGATNWFIRVPFMLEGLIDGIVGAMLALAVTYVVRDTIVSFVSNNSLGTTGSTLGVTSGDALVTGLAVLAVGAVIGGVRVGLRGAPVPGCVARWPSRSRTTPSSATPRPPRWSAATARSTGCACPASTPAPASPPCSGRPSNGRWLIAPGGRRIAPARRRYREDTLVLETEFETADGAVRVDRLHAAARRRSPTWSASSRACAGRSTMRMRAASSASTTARSCRGCAETDDALRAIAGPDALCCAPRSRRSGED